MASSNDNVVIISSDEEVSQPPSPSSPSSPSSPPPFVSPFLPLFHLSKLNDRLSNLEHEVLKMHETLEEAVEKLDRATRDISSLRRKLESLQTNDSMMSEGSDSQNPNTDSD